MPIRIINKSDLEGTNRHVKTHAYETYRFLLRSDNADVTVTDIRLAPGIEEVYGYDKHIEIAYCLEGRATLSDDSSGRQFEISPGTMWVAQRGDQFRFRASEPTRLICVFSPPFDGNETGFAGDQ